MVYQMLHLSYKGAVISRQLFHHVNRCRGRKVIAKREFSQTVRAGDVAKDAHHESGYKVSRVGSVQKTVIRSVSAPAYHPTATVSGETIVDNSVLDAKLNSLQAPQGVPQQEKHPSGIKTQESIPTNKNVNDESKPKPGAWPMPGQFTIISPDPKRTTRLEVLHLIKKRARMGRHKYLSGFRLDLRHRAQAFVILVTPAFAEWLKDDFIEDVIRTMTYHFGHRISKRVTVVSAVVDGLAPSPDDIPIAERVGPLQGISILYGLKHQILSAKSMWKPESFKDTSKDPDKLSHLILLGQIPIKQRESSLRVSISLPLANTLFVNGQHSTLEVSQWMRSSRDRYTLVRSAQKQYQHIKAFYHGNTMIPPIFVPAVPLTLPRRIASGLGNIVRQLSFERRGGDIRPASSELETQVTRYMKFSKLHTTIGVWALIYRKELLDPNLKATTLERTEELQSTWGNDDENLRFVGTRLALGAILCRVVSGGGGWGAKQGLLSLDPQITHGDIPSAGADYISDSMQESQNPTLGNLARPGDYIQFFTIKPSKLKDHKSSMEESSPSTVALGENPSVAGDGPPDSKYITKQPEISGLASKEYNDIDWSKRVVFGVVPSTIDELPKSDTTEASSSRNGTVPLAFRKGEFGAVSESGVYLYAPHKRGINSTKFEHINTKIDMPYSFLYIDQLVTLPPREPGKSKLKPSLGSTGSSDIKNVSSASESAKESQSTTTGKRPSQKGAAEVSGQQNASTSKANQVSDSTIRKTRVGHTRWPKFLPKKEKPKKEKPLNIRKIKTHHKERTFRFRLDENRSS